MDPIFPEGKRHRERVGTRGNAIKLRDKRKTQILVDQKLPDLQRRGITMGELLDDVLPYTEAHKSARDYRPKAELVRKSMGSRAAESIIAGDIEGWIRRRNVAPSVAFPCAEFIQKRHGCLFRAARAYIASSAIEVRALGKPAASLSCLSNPLLNLWRKLSTRNIECNSRTGNGGENLNAPLVWGVSKLYNIPNFCALLCLAVLLAVLQSRFPRLRIGIWKSALFCLIFEQLLWYIPGGPVVPFPLIHALRLIAELSAGILFLLYHHASTDAMEEEQRYVLLNLPPLLALQAMYGFDVFGTTPYLICATLGVAVAVVTRARIPTNRHFAYYVVLWLFVAVAAATSSYRLAAYGATAIVYLMAAANFWRQLPLARVGRTTIVVSLVIWAGSLFLHPLVMLHTQFRDVAEQTWAMQKFIVSFGMLIALFEIQATENDHLAIRDQLTGIGNRLWMMRALQSQISSGHAELVLLDLNHFKQVNDSFGHAAGDALLCQISAKLTALCQKNESVARLGGDEFVLIGDGGLISRLSEISEAVSGPAILGPDKVSVSCSMGVAVFPEDIEGSTSGDAISDMLRVADSRMYDGKAYRNDLFETSEISNRLVL